MTKEQWIELADRLDCVEAGNLEEADALFCASEAIRREQIDCPCGGWDCTGAPEGPMYGCPYVVRVACDHRKLQDGTVCPACGCRGNGEA